MAADRVDEMDNNTAGKKVFQNVIPENMFVSLFRVSCFYRE